MKIGIDASSIESSKRTGVGNYLIYLLKYLGKLFPENEYVLYFNNTIPQYDFLEQKCFIKKILKKPWFLFFSKGPLWNTYCLPLELIFHKVDTFFSPIYTIPFFGLTTKSVVTIFDISYEVHPEWFAPHWAKIVRSRSKKAAKKSNAIITISQFSKNEIVKYYKLDEKKVNVTYLGVDDFFLSLNNSTKINEIKRKYGIEKNFILYIGVIYPRRNIEILISAFKNIADKIENYQLLIIGENIIKSTVDIPQLIKETNTYFNSKKIIPKDYVSQEDILLLYNAADIFIFPSSYEGFGLTVLEAMACGCPVITSNISSLPEVVGDAGIYVDPTNVNEISSAIFKVLTDENLKKEMREKSLKRAKYFTWEKTARETMDIFKSLL